ncbi:hypothetical protein O181_091349 [Austropuccinia psidii MF-1]|uniref:Integrase catalytic domain-containing protein n=1 Tax=Austropuccinia psidii MF-1 TaxID=1389203 RepID=A0A9Q3IXE8_9BASI|nr:hypothetical protein [Austropuccinia psidii MF-1]
MFPTTNLSNLHRPTCELCKITKSPLKGSFPTPQRCLQFIHTDLFGPIEVPSNSRYKYCLIVVDGYSRYIWTAFLKSKSEKSIHLQKIYNCIKNQCNEKITNIVSDTESKFKNEQPKTYFQNKGISHLTTTPYTPQQNPFTKRGNCTTITKARCIFKESGLNKSYWAEAVRTTTYLENITPKKYLNYSTPFHNCNKEISNLPNLTADLELQPNINNLNISISNNKKSIEETTNEIQTPPSPKGNPNPANNAPKKKIGTNMNGSPKANHHPMKSMEKSEILETCWNPKDNPNMWPMLSPPFMMTTQNHTNKL